MTSRNITKILFIKTFRAKIVFSSIIQGLPTKSHKLKKKTFKDVQKSELHENPLNL